MDIKKSLADRVTPLKASAIREIFKALSDPTIISLAAGNPEEGYLYPQHHPKVKFDEKVDDSINLNVYAEKEKFEFVELRKPQQNLC